MRVGIGESEGEPEEWVIANHWVQPADHDDGSDDVIRLKDGSEELSHCGWLIRNFKFLLFRLRLWLWRWGRWCWGWWCHTHVLRVSESGWRLAVHVFHTSVAVSVFDNRCSLGVNLYSVVLGLTVEPVKSHIDLENVSRVIGGDEHWLGELVRVHFVGEHTGCTVLPKVPVNEHVWISKGAI
jgi:hypothetical protein